MEIGSFILVPQTFTSYTRSSKNATIGIHVLNLRFDICIGVAWIKNLRGPNSGAARILVRSSEVQPTKKFYKNLINSI